MLAYMLTDLHCDFICTFGVRHSSAQSVQLYTQRICTCVLASELHTVRASNTVYMLCVEADRATQTMVSTYVFAHMCPFLTLSALLLLQGQLQSHCSESPCRLTTMSPTTRGSTQMCLTTRSSVAWMSLHTVGLMRVRVTSCAWRPCPRRMAKGPECVA